MTVDRWTGRETRLLRHALRLIVRPVAQIEDEGGQLFQMHNWNVQHVL